MYIQSDEQAIAYLKKKDKKLAAAIDSIGHLQRAADADLFSSVIHHIIGQQISIAAQKTIWQRLQHKIPQVSVHHVHQVSVEDLQQLGMTFKKAEYIKDFVKKVHEREFDLDTLWQLSDAEVITKLSSLKGIGVWTAEMLLTFCMKRPNIISFGDLAILRGMRMLYHHRKIDRKLFEKYAKRYSPYATTASLYLWAIAGGAIPEMKDYAPSIKKITKK